MDRNQVFNRLKRIFEENNDLTIKELIQIAGDAYHEVQLDSIGQYQPIYVEPKVKSSTEYESEIQQNTSDTVGDSDLRALNRDQDVADSQDF